MSVEFSSPVEWLLNIGGRVLAISDVIAQIDTEIFRLGAEILELQQAKAMLGGSAPVAAAAAVAAAPVKSGRRGRPKGSKNSKPVVVKAAEPKAPAKATKRKLSPEGRKAIADAMKLRWAERRKVAAK